MAGRPAPRPLEVEVMKKFKRHDVHFEQARRKQYPYLVKDPPPTGGAGTGSVLWVGLNADPCKAKFLAKAGIDTKKRVRAQSAPSRRRESMVDESEPQGKTTRRRPTSAPGRRHDRDLSTVSAAGHYLEQKLKLPGVLPIETFTPLGTWPANGAVKPNSIEELLYNGVSHDQEGRFAYLKARAKMSPQKKTKFPVTSSQEVAWEVWKGKKSRCLHPVRSRAAACAVPC